MSMIEELRARADELAGEMVDVRREIHRRPELGLDNPATRDLIERTLAPLGLDVLHSEGTSGLSATLVGGKPGPTVMLRADTDALPMTEHTEWDHRSEIDGQAHMCGHDAHVAMLLGAAKMLTEVRDELPGTVRFVFQPGEEGFAGAAVMVEEGALAEGLSRPVDATFALHVAPNVPLGFVAGRPGAQLAGTDDFYVTVKGKGGHASTPHFGVDPIPVACEMVLALQSLVTRRVDAFDPAVLTVAHIDSGTTTNVIPPTAFFEGTIRTVSDHTRSVVREGVERVLRGIAAAHDCEVDVRIDAGYPVTFNDEAFAGFASGVVEEVLGEHRFYEMPAPVMGGEDFSYFLQKVPGAMFFLGVCPADIDNFLEAPSCHSNLMRLNEEALPLGAAIHASMAWRYLESNV